MNAELNFILALPGRLERTAALAWWLQSLYADESERPVLIGGAAMELFTAGAYITDDLDFVGSVPDPVAKKLIHAGFALRDSQWLYEKESVSFVFHDRKLREGERAAEFVFGDHRVRMLSPGDLLIHRLSVWRHRQSPAHGVQAYLLYYFTRGSIDIAHLTARAIQEDVRPALDSLIRLFFMSKGQLPKAQDLGKWAGKCLG